MIDDIIPSIREECTVDGQALQLAVPARHHQHGLALGPDATRPASPTCPATWDEFLADGKKIVDKKAAPCGATFDAHGWRSLAPITHSMSTKVYTPEASVRLHQRPGDRGAEADEADHGAVAIPNVLNRARPTRGVNGTPDEIAFAAQHVGLYFKYFNAPLRLAATWHDPNQLQLGAAAEVHRAARARRCSGRPAACLFKYGQNKEKAAEYMKALTYDQQIWKDSIVGTPTAHPGQLPPYKSLYAGWDANKPDWMQPFVPLVLGQLKVPRRSPTTCSGCSSSSSASRSGRSTSRARSPTPRWRCRRHRTRCRPRPRSS